MTRTSPSVQRVVAVLNLFADHPDQAFTLTDVVKTLRLSRATCHGLLAGLVEAGYLYRATDKSYVLGSALLHVGEMAKAHFSPMKVAQPEIRAIADEFDGVCAASFRERLEVVVRERAAAVSHLGYSTPRGTRLPLLPQFAGPFFVGASRMAVKEWADSFDPPCSAAQIDALMKGLEFTREHGFLFAVRKGAVNVSDRRWIEDRAITNAPVTTMFEIKEKSRYDVVFVTAPVFDAHREVAFTLTLTGLEKSYSGAEVLKMGARMREACDRISSFMSRPSALRG